MYEMSLDRSPLVSGDDDDLLSSSPSFHSETFIINTNIVGLQGYRGGISGGEKVVLFREPLNRYDPNAIKVFDALGFEVGRIEKKAADVLAPLIDSNLVHVEGSLPEIPEHFVHYTIPCLVHVFAKPEAFETVRLAFLRKGLCVLSERNLQCSSSKAVVVEEKKKKSNLDEIFKLVGKHLSQNAVSGVIDPPSDIILPDLFLHQKQALYWLYHRENSDELLAFWEHNDHGYMNVLTDYHTDRRPNPLRGGIFARHTGLGKTLTILTLIALDKYTASNDVKAEVENGTFVNPTLERSRRASRKWKADEYTGQVAPKITLIVYPPSVVATWQTQLAEHTKCKRLKFYLYYGQRTQDVFE
ncbi:putative chromatin remodeling SNF2 family [Helianthus annuus]|uniref:Chromatin remodeling SNF2 family n=2 Tax=Helianthus annuus TaxID=4232 RepID=A0A9K3JTQ3_HELAN|nr:putative chromatin remodeling SNF2 family [Helianthus annuus]KAJ0626110.1 putative chromatin remodeling SNF2 family [Helianthus annuus]KAJ0782443.1 putative chromatin remodeling SNF2 family [Helianthus annuus]KAJ0947049.1 putative chromatin remodeling SNF2 family [Helianthus annuus]